MSKVVDQKVVEMQFDNRHFEKNVATTMTTLEKLKKSLKLPDASKSLDGINHAAKNVNLSGIGRAVDTVQTKFSALEVMGVTALANITNSAVNAGKRMVAALTIDPVRTGFQEYELKMGSIQTIMASTGESLDTVNKYLEQLNEYSDKTIYSFQDMTQNIGKFTNAGVKLDDAVKAIKGISNEAAVSGANANEASRAMYNFAQALSAGYVKLVDWKSIELANMATVEFKNQLIETAVSIGTVTKGADGMFKTLEGNAFNATKNFNEVLQDQWMTTDVLVTTLGKYADETTDIGKKAMAAAQDVKTFSMMMDTLKESAQSGWAKTWEIIVGDYDESKSLFTMMSNAIGGVIDKMSDARNTFLEDTLSSPWEKVSKQIQEAGIDIEEFKDKLRKTARSHNKALDQMSDEQLTFDRMLQDGIVTKGLVIETLNDYVKNLDGVSESTANMSDKLKYFQKVVDQVWRGDYQNGKDRIEALTEAGYEYAEVQELVNKTIDGHRLTLEDLSDVQLKAIGYTDEQIVAIHKLAEEAKKAGTPLSELLERMTKPSGRQLLIESFSNILTAFTKPLNSIKEAFNDTFGDINISESIYKIIEAFHDLTEKMIISDDAAKNLKTVFEAIFESFKIGNLVVSKSLVAGLKILDAVLELMGTNIADAAGYVANLIKKMADWLNTNVKFLNTYDKIAEIIVAVIDGIKACIDAFKGLPQITGIIKSIEDKVVSFFSSIGTSFDASAIEKFIAVIDTAFSKAAKWIESLRGSENLGRDLVNGLVNGLTAGVRKVVETVVSFAKTIIEAFCEVTGIASPSKVFFALGGFIIAGLIAGLQNGFPEVWEALKGFGTACAEFLGNISFGQILAAGLSVGMLITVKKILDIAKMFGGAAEGFGNMMSGVGKMCTAVANRIDPKKTKMEMIIEMLKSLALVFLALTASAYVLGKMETNELIKAGVALGVMTAIIAGLAVLTTKLKGIDGGEMSFRPLITIVGSLLIMALVLKQLSKIHLEDVPAVLASMTVMIAGMAAMLYAYGKLAKGQSAKYMDKAGAMMVKMSVALMAMVGVFKLVSMVTDDEIYRGIAVVGAVELMFMAMTAVVKGSGKNAVKVGGMMLAMSLAMATMVGVIKLASQLDAETVLKGVGVLALVEVLFTAMVAVSKYAGKHATKAGVMLLAMSGAFAITMFVIKQAGELDSKDIQNGLIVVAALEVLFMAIIAVSKKAGKHAMQAGVMLLAMSGALLIMSGVMFILSKMDPKGMWRGLAAVTILESLIIGLVAVTQKSKKCMGTLIMLTLIVATLTVAVTALSMIPPEKLAAGTAAISAVIGMFALLIGVTKYAKNTKDMRRTLLYLVGVVAAMAAVVVALSLIDADSALTSCMALSMVMVAFATSIAIISKSSRILPTVAAQLQPMMLVVTELAVILGLMAYLDVEASIENALALAVLLNAFSSALVILSYAGPMAAKNVTAMATMGLVVAELAVILGLMAALDINVGIETALGMSALLLAMAGACAIVGLIPAALAIDGALGLSAFVGIMAGLLLVLGGFSKIPGFNELIGDGGGTLASIGYAIGAFVGSIIGGLGGGISAGLPVIGENLGAFVESLTPFVEGISKFDDKVLAGVKTLAEAILILTATELLQGVASFIGFGDASLSNFGSQLSNLGTGMNGFASNLGTFTDAQVTSVTCASNALKAIAQAASEIPNEGGWIAKLVGDNGIATFAPKLPELGLNLGMFVKNLGTFGQGQLDAVTNAGQALSSIANAASEIPNEGGWLSTLFGENSISTFAPKLPALGAYLAAFVKNLGGFDKDHVEYAVNAGKAITAIAESAAEIPNDGGMWGKIFGDNSLSSFAGKLPDLGNNIKTFVSEISGVGSAKVTSAATVLQAIVDLVNIDFTSESAGLTTFCEKMKTLATDAVDEFVKGMTGRTSKNKAKDAVKEVADAAAEKAESKSCYNGFYDAGQSLVDGLAAGISDNKSAATTAAQNVANAVEDIIRSAWEVNSPSKLFYRIALGIGEGVTNALVVSGSRVYASTSEFADRATKGFTAALQTVNDTIHSDIDANPTIRPVLDLTNIRSGVSAMNGMLGTGYPVTAMANVGAISSMMNLRSQVGLNGDVVTAIDKLRHDLGKVGNTYNSINGITYDDGTNVSEAIKVLVRAAKVERRV